MSTLLRDPSTKDVYRYVGLDESGNLLLDPVPVDKKTGAGAGERARASFGGWDAEDQLREWQAIRGKDNVRLSQDGEVETWEGDHWRRVDEEGLSWTDFADMPGKIPEVAASALGAIGLMGTAPASVPATLALASLGAAGGAAAGDVARQVMDVALPGGGEEKGIGERLQDVGQAALWGGAGELAFGAGAGLLRGAARGVGKPALEAMTGVPAEAMKDLSSEAGERIWPLIGKTNDAIGEVAGDAQAITDRYMQMAQRDFARQFDEIFPADVAVDVTKTKKELDDTLQRFKVSDGKGGINPNADISPSDARKLLDIHRRLQNVRTAGDARSLRLYMDDVLIKEKGKYGPRAPKTRAAGAIDHLRSTIEQDIEEVAKKVGVGGRYKKIKTDFRDRMRKHKDLRKFFSDASGESTVRNINSVAKRRIRETLDEVATEMPEAAPVVQRMGDIVNARYFEPFIQANKMDVGRGMQGLLAGAAFNSVPVAAATYLGTRPAAIKYPLYYGGKAMRKMKGGKGGTHAAAEQVPPGLLDDAAPDQAAASRALAERADSAGRRYSRSLDGVEDDPRQFRFDMDGNTEPGRKQGTLDESVEAKRKPDTQPPGRRKAAPGEVSARQRNWQKTGTKHLRGQELRSIYDLGDVVARFEDEPTETLRVLYVKDGKIVAHEATNSGHPSFASTAAKGETKDDFANGVRRRIGRLDADGVYLVHNHPSGSTTPSRPDRVLTKSFADKFPEFKGHAVVSRRGFELIDSSGNVVTAAPKRVQDGDSLRRFNGPEQLIDAVNDGQIPMPSSDGNQTIVMIDSKGQIAGTFDVSEDLIASDGFIGFLRNRGREVGSSRAIAIGKKSPIAIDAVRRGILTDFIDPDSRYSAIRHVDTGGTDIFSRSKSDTKRFFSRSRDDLAERPDISDLGFRFSEADVTSGPLRRAYDGISMVPERRVKAHAQEYVDHMNAVAEHFSKQAVTPQQRAVLRDELARYKDNYLKHFNGWMTAKGRTMSSMVTGPSNFPVARNRKHLDREHALLEQFMDWEKKAHKAIARELRKAKTPDQMVSDKMDELRQWVDGVVASLKSYEAGTDTFGGKYRPTFQITSLAEKLKREAANGEIEAVRDALEYIRQQQAQLKKPVFTARHGAWKLGEAAEQSAAESAAKTGTVDVAQGDGVRIITNHDADRVQILFDEKPDAEMRKKLKGYGWRWSPKNNAWQRKATPMAERSAIEVTGAQRMPKQTEIPSYPEKVAEPGRPKLAMSQQAAPDNSFQPSLFPNEPIPSTPKRRIAPDDKRQGRLFSRADDDVPLTPKGLGLTPQQFAEVEDYLAHAKTVKPLLDDSLDKLAAVVDGQPLKAPVKSLKRSGQKVAADYGGDVKQLKDAARGTVMVRDAVEAAKVYKQLQADFPDRIGEDRINLVDDSFAPDGYRDVKTVVQFDGFPAEIQINTPQNIIAKEAVHGLYEQRQNLERAAGTIKTQVDEFTEVETFNFTPEQWRQHGQLNDAMRELFEDAAQADYDQAAEAVPELLSIKDASERAASALNVLSEIGAPLRIAVSSENGFPTLPSNLDTFMPPSSVGQAATAIPSTSQNRLPAGKPEDIGTSNVKGGASGTTDTDIVGNLTGKGKPDSEPQFSGGGTIAHGPNGEQFNMKYRLIPLKDLIVSHDRKFKPNPKFNQRLQPRDRTKQAYREQVDGLFKKFEPDRVLHDTREIQTGLPIIAADGTVLSGNGRGMTMVELKHRRPKVWREYQDQMRQKLEQYGLDPAAADAMEDAVLVRELVDDIDHAEFARLANDDAIASMGDVEAALSSAARLKDSAIQDAEIPEQIGNFTQFVNRNQSLSNGVIGAMSEGERAGLKDRGGRLNKSGVQRVKSTLFAKTYGGEKGLELLEQFAESASDQLKGLEHSLFNSLPAMSVMESRIRVGKIDPAFSIADDVQAAAKKRLELAREGQSVQAYLDQLGMFGSELTPTQEALLRFIGENAQSYNNVAKVLHAYAQKAVKLPPASQSTMFDAEAITKNKLLSQAIAETAEGFGTSRAKDAAQKAVGEIADAPDVAPAPVPKYAAPEGSQTTQTATGGGQQPTASQTPPRTDTPPAATVEPQQTTPPPAAAATEPQPPGPRPDAEPQTVVPIDVIHDEVSRARKVFPGVQIALMRKHEPGIRGYFEGGKVWVNPYQVKSPQELREVILHEIVGHKGLRETVGRDLEPLLRRVKRRYRQEVQRRIESWGIDENEAAEEVLAEMAEQGAETGFVGEVVGRIREVLSKKFDVDLSDKDVQFLLARSARSQQGGYNRPPITTGIGGAMGVSAQ